jgi:aminopeptidase N
MMRNKFLLVIFNLIVVILFIIINQGSSFQNNNKASYDFSDLKLQSSIKLSNNFLNGYITKNQTKIDILNYNLNFELYHDDKYFDAFAEIKGVVLDPSIEKIDLNFYDNFKIKKVSLNKSEVDYENIGTRFSIPLKEIITDTFTINIVYSGTPKRVGLDGFVFGQRDGYSVIYTLNEPNYASSWFPCNDIPDDKALLEMKITNDSSKISVSNGKLVEITDHNNRRTYYWKTLYPISTYLIALYSADYVSYSEKYVSRDGLDTMPIIYYVLPDKLEKSKIDFAEHVNMLEVLSDLFGEYPFIKEKYAVAEFLWMMGAMENQTITGISSGLIGGTKYFNDYFVHELAHHWWGNAIGPKSWKDIWLNEGFSTYSEALYFESVNGSKALQSVMMKKYSNNLRGTLIDPGASLFNTTVYNKGAWVLNMLRWEVGDSAFFKILRSYYENYKYSNASTQDFIDIAIKVSGKNLEMFFNQWLNYEDNINVSYFWKSTKVDTSHRIEINIEQLQKAPDVYHFPLEILIEFESGNIATERFYINSRRITFDFEFEEEVTSVSLDPDKWLLGTFVEETSSK